MQTCIFYYNEAFEYLHMIDTIKKHFEYNNFHYEQKQIVKLTKHNFQYAIELLIPTFICEHLQVYYKNNTNVKLEIQEYTLYEANSKSKLKNQKHLNTDICNYDDVCMYEKSNLIKPENKSQRKRSYNYNKTYKHISKKTYDELYNVLNSK